MKGGKLMMAAGAVMLGVMIGILYMNYTAAEHMNEDEARAIITERYQGDIRNVSLAGDDEHFVVSVDDDEYLYEITINRAEGTVVDIESAENPEYEPDDAVGEEQESEEGSSGAEPGTSEDNAGLIPVKEAREIAMEEVGGLFLHSTLNTDTNPSEYLIANLVDDDDEAAIVSINAVNGTINKVIFLEIEFDEIGDLETFMRQVAQSNAQNQNYYIEYDDWDDDWDDD
ncbi:PepSY domain-containing protein [Lacicoccus alkaliphilus]|uniref:Peptidase propeptide and YPEB domain-containing protein n=1 Tax=Lacicoccus alkaliphilus DSM 16010 TaxID=1123231 RepID=A0A1M7E566_9BACL|nr:PepSY domain-containing protein [Salinicoccus alkaliphilus]SHL86830.1 Peptidase propeptide and YPEB domain-containing protein [Salinicoccus alkaliphilus DSM 16010]